MQSIIYLVNFMKYVNSVVAQSLKSSPTLQPHGPYVAPEAPLSSTVSQSLL